MAKYGLGRKCWKSFMSKVHPRVYHNLNKATRVRKNLKESSQLYIIYLKKNTMNFIYLKNKLLL